MRGRPQRVGRRIDDVATAVALKVDGQPEEGRGHELRLPERPGPGAVELVGRHVAAIDDFQRRHQFRAEIAGPLAEAGKRRQRLHERALAHLRAEIQFDAPDRRENVAADAIGLFRPSQRARFPSHRRLAVGDPLVIDEGGHIVPDRGLELGLILLEIEHLHIRRKAAEGCVEGRARDAGLGGVGLELRHAAGEIRVRRRRGDGRGEHGEKGKRDAFHAGIIRDSPRSVENQPDSPMARIGNSRHPAPSRRALKAGSSKVSHFKMRRESRQGLQTANGCRTIIWRFFNHPQRR